MLKNLTFLGLYLVQLWLFWKSASLWWYSFNSLFAKVGY